MVNFTVDEIRRMMGYRHNIRSMSVIAHVDHGKSTLTDSLIGAAGIIAMAKAGDSRFMDTRPDEQERTITIKSTAVSLFFAMPDESLEGKPKLLMEELKKNTPEGERCYPVDVCADEGKTPFLINLIDSPGHVDFSSEVTAALRVTDGALVVVDCIEGVCVQTETVLRQAIAERIKPVLFVNKLDRIFLELGMDNEEAYGNFNRAVESVNVVISTYHDDLLGDVQVYPEKGTVGFGSGLMSWGFTIGRFAAMYADKFQVPKEKMMDRLWGSNYFNMKKGAWTKKRLNDAGKPMKRAFCQFVLEPIKSMLDAVMQQKTKLWEKMLTAMGAWDKLPKEAKNGTLLDKPLLKCIMQTWLPASDALLEMIVNHLPSPVTAQSYRVQNLYAGPMDDGVATAIRNCDPDGPLMMYVSKMVPTSEKGRFYAFGRVFSGIIKTGQTVRILGPDYSVENPKKDMFEKKVQRTVLMMGRYVEQIPDCPCGNIVGLVGVDQYILKAATITTDITAHPLVTMKYSVSPVVRQAVECVNAADLPKLMEGLKRLGKSDPLVQCFTSPKGEHIIAGAGELHLEICMKDLRDDFMKGAPIKILDPVVSFCETVMAATDRDMISKSPNKHNRLYVRASPTGEEFCKGIDDGTINLQEDAKIRARVLADKYGFDIGDARKIWSFGCPPDAKCNVIVDMTKAVQYLQEIQDSVVGGFIQATAAGILCDEAMRGIRFNLMDVTLHADSIHRGAGQIMPTVKRAIFACQISSSPSLLEPMYICDIVVPETSVSGVYATLNARRGVVEGKETRPGTPLTKIKAFLPVLESFGFAQLLRQNTSGQAFPQMIFSHWQPVQGEVYEENSQANSIVNQVRTRKGLKEGLPDLNDYYDKL